MTALVAYGLPALAWAAVIYKLPALRRSPDDPALRAYWLTLLTLALGVTVMMPPIYLTISQLTGVPNLARLLGNSLGLVAGWSVQVFLAHLSGAEAAGRETARRLGIILVGALTLMAVLFAAAPVDKDTLDFAGGYGDVPFVLEYRLAFLAYFGLASGNVARHSWRYAHVVDRPALRLGLRLVALGGLAGVSYVIHEGLYVVARRFGFGYPLPDPNAITQVLVVLGVGLTVIGSTMPSWGPRIGVPRLCQWFDQYRSLQRLYPLWTALCRSTPEIALVPPRSALVDAVTLRDIGFRLYRRVVEIHDGWLALRPYFDPRVERLAAEVCQQAGLVDEEAKAVIAAASLAAAVRAKERGQTANGRAVPPEVMGGADLSSEVVTLERVAHCYAHSPIVRVVLAGVEQANAVEAHGTRYFTGER